MPKSEAFEKHANEVVGIVERIPAGQLMTYGGIGKVVGIVPRYVALIMATAEDVHSSPWHRVVGADGRVKSGAHRSEQIKRLRVEGVTFDGNRIIDFSKRIYQPA
jgi:methylated-DNA-protein-cysteine methyltransferase related protein